MLILPKSCFLHVPKTGGTWVREAVVSAGISCQHYDVSGDKHIGLTNCPCPEKFKFAFVRHPIDFYRSYWQFRMTVGWDPENPLDQACQSEDFLQFVRQALNKFPGIYSTSLNEYVGEADDEIEFVGRYENLVDDLITALTLAGEDFDEHAIRTLPPLNVSNKTEFPAFYSVSLEAAVKEAECAMMQRFNYQ